MKKLRKTLALLLAVIMAMITNFPSGLFPGIDIGLTVYAEEAITFEALDGTLGACDEENCEMLIDGDPFTKWCVTKFSNAYIVFKASEPIYVKGYTITTGNDNEECTGRNPKNWTLQGCNDYDAEERTGSWETIDTVENDDQLQDENNKDYDFQFAVTKTAYQYFKFEITAIKGAKDNCMQMSEFTLSYTTCEHTWGTEPTRTIAPTCTEGGYDVYTCTKCQEEKKVANESAALGHNYVNDVCSVCGASKAILEIDEEHFPDVNFREYVNANCDTDGDGSLSDAEIAEVTGIEYFKQDISNLKGIEYFTELTYLDCSGNRLNSLDVSKNTALTYLDCYDNQLNSLDVSKNTALEYLNCFNNRLNSLDVSKNTKLKYLNCYGNTYEITLDNRTFDLSTLPGTFDVGKAGNWTGGKVSGNILTFDSGVTKVTYDYDCGRNFSVTFTLDATPKYTVTFDANGGSVTPASAETGEDGKLGSLPTPTRKGYIFGGWYTAAAAGTKVTTETEFNADTTIYAHWTENGSTPDDVDINETNFPDDNFRAYVSQNFDIDENNKLSDAEIAGVTGIECFNQDISNLKGIEYFTELTYLDCSGNQLTSLDVSQNTDLYEMDCYGNQLTSLDVSKNTALEYLDCVDNRLTSLDVSKNTALMELYCDDNTYEITLDNGTFDLSTLPGTFDVGKAGNWTGGKLSGDKKTLTFDSGVTKVTYDYDCGRDFSVTFTLDATLDTNPKYTVSFDANGGSGSMADVTSVSGSYTLPACGYTAPEGKQFKGWATSADGTAISGTTITVTADTTLYAIWENAPVATYTVSFNANGGTLSGNQTAQTDDNGKLGSLPTPIREGYTFDGWYTAAADGTEVTTETKFTEDTTIYARWTKNAIYVEINETNFPDDNFRAYVSQNFDIDENNKLSDAEIADVTSIYCRYKDISNLKGIEYFTELTYLDCESNQLTSLNLGKNTKLQTLDCQANPLASLDVSDNTYLEKLSCTSGELTKLDVSQNTKLTELSCGNNNLTDLDVGKNTELTKLDCSLNYLTNLDVSKNTKLTELKCTYNKLTSLDLSNTGVNTLSASGNTYEITLGENRTFDLSTLPGTFDASKAGNWAGGTVSGTTLTVDEGVDTVTYDYNYKDGNTVSFTLHWDDGEGVAIDEAHFPDTRFRNYVLRYIDKGSGTLGAREIANTTSIECGVQGISDLKGIEYFTNLEILYCYVNDLKVLDVSQNTKLTHLQCRNNYLTNLDVSSNTALTSLSASDNTYEITLGENRTFDLSTLPGKFDVSKAGNWQGGTVSGNILTFNSGVTKVTYDYDCGRDFSVTFTLDTTLDTTPKYTITFDATGGSVTPASAETDDNGKLGSLPTPIREGYTFDGWYTAETGGEKVTVSTVHTKNTTLYAHWTENGGRGSFTNQVVNKKYLYTRDNADSIDLSNYLPENCGTVNYGAPQVEGALYTEDGAPAISNGTLSYTVKKADASGATGTIQITVTTDNYEDYTITVNVELIDKIPVSLKAGSSVSLENSTLTYGEALSTLTFKSAVFLGDGNEVAGTLAWKTPDAKPDVAAAKAEWVFTPTNTEYASEEGEVAITVKKATPNVTAAPTAAGQNYHPEKKLGDIALTGGTVLNVNGTALTGTWSWENAEVIPTVGNSGYTAVFTPNETDKANYETVTRTITVTINKAESAPNKPDNTMEADYSKKKVSDITTLPEGWAWQDADKDRALTVGTPVTATAVYTGADKGNYEIESVEISITRKDCTHAKDEGTRVEPTCENKGSITYKCTKCGEVMDVVELAATGHKWDAGKVTKEPTETAEGEKTYTCTACGGTKTEPISKKEAVTPEPPKNGDVVADDKASAKVEVADATKKEVEYKAPANKKAKTVTIPATVTIDGVTYKVTKIADNAFKGNKTVNKVTIGSNIKTIGKNAFSGATKLKKVTIGKNVTEIGANAFKGCSSLTSITLPSNVTKIGANAFSGCKKLKTLTIKSTKLTSKTVAKNAFKGLTKATTIKVPKKKLEAYKKLFKSKGLSSKVTVKGN